MIYVVELNNKKYEVEVEKGQANIIRTTDVPVANPVVQVQAAPEANAQTSAAVNIEENIDGNPIVAPMPGNVIDIKVNAGVRVKKGQMLFILEAMKMENEVYSPYDGTVTKVLVSKGATVATNDIMMIIK